MTDRNAAIWFSSDGFDPKAKGINGRRVAGESFLRGFLRHADVPEYVSLAFGGTDHALFADVARSEGVKRPVRAVRLDEIHKIAAPGCLYYSSPGIALECWRRAAVGATHHSICGITHTTATKAVMEQVWTLRMAPQQPWDGVICTSRAVKASMDVQMDLIDGYIRQRFGTPPPARPQMPIIPLGIATEDMTRDEAAGAALRGRLGLGKDDVLCLTLARLSVNEKFDPLPLYLALARAQAGLRRGQRLHMALCGIFAGNNSREIFTKGAAVLMPGVPLHILNGADAVVRKEALSGADIFLFPIDNIQETFGLAPVEAMAAGLPIVASDWDGLRDTVTPDTGFLIPTEAVRPELTTSTTLRYMGGTDNYSQYLSQVSAVTRLNVPAMARAILTLALDPALRRRMGTAGLARARGTYDWRHVIPLMQDFWAELAAIRKAADPAAHPPTPASAVPVAPSPTLLFGAYPTRIFAPGDRRYQAVVLDGRPDLKATLSLRDYLSTKRLFELPEHIHAVQAALTARGDAAATLADLIVATGFPARRVERILIWLLKYDFAVEAGHV
jgi:Glycosyl transferases group 1